MIENKLVIYKDFNGYCVTNETNYYSLIRDERKVTKAYDFDSAIEIIEYYCKYFGMVIEDFIIISQ